jgi:hypothetical protein
MFVMTENIMKRPLFKIKVVQNVKQKFYFEEIAFEIRSIYEIMCKNVVKSDSPS